MDYPEQAEHGAGTDVVGGNPAHRAANSVARPVRHLEWRVRCRGADDPRRHLAVLANRDKVVLVGPPAGTAELAPDDEVGTGQHRGNPPTRREGDGDVSVHEILGQVLRDAVWERLDELTELANRADAPSSLSVARCELPRLIEDWQTLLTVHTSDDQGNCPECSTRWRPQEAPCAVWRSAYEHLVSGALAPRSARHPRPTRTSRPAAPVP